MEQREELERRIKEYWISVGACMVRQDNKTLGACHFALKALYLKLARLEEQSIINLDE